MNRHLIELGLGLSLFACARVDQPVSTKQPSLGQALTFSSLGTLDTGIEPGTVRVAADGRQFWVTYLKSSKLYYVQVEADGGRASPIATAVAASPDEYAIAALPTVSMALVRSNSNQMTVATQSIGGTDAASFPGGSDVTWPALAAGDQDFLGVWVSGQNIGAQPGSAILAQRIGTQAEFQGSAATRLTSVGGDQYAVPSVAGAGAGGPFIIAWEATDGGASTTGIESVVLFGDGGHSAPLELSPPGVESRHPVVASNGTEFMVVWLDESGVANLSFGNVGFDGTRLSNSAQLQENNLPIERCTTPVVAYDGRSYLIGCVSVDDGAVDLFATQSDGGATRIATTQGANANDGANGASFGIAALPCVSTLVAYENEHDGGADAGSTIDVDLELLSEPLDAGACVTSPPATTGLAGSGSGTTTGGSGTSGSSGSSSTTGGSSGGGMTTGQPSSGGTTAGSTTSGTTGSNGATATSGAAADGGASGSADVFACSAGGMGLTPLALLGLLALRRRRGAGLLVVLAALGTIGVASPAHAAPKSARAKVAVLTIEAKLGVSPDLAELLTTRLVARIQDVTGQAVISSEDIKHALGLERTKQLLGCSESSCMAELGGALGVDYLVTGTIAKVGNARTFDAEIMNTAKAVVLHRYSHRLPPGADDSAFLDEVAPAVAALFPEAQLPRESTAAPEKVASATPVEVQQPTAPASERRFLIDLLATSELTEKGGYARLRVGYWVIPSLAIVAGALTTFKVKPGVQGGLELQPFAITSSLKPFISAAGQAVFTDAGTSAGVTGSIGLAWSPVSHLVLRAEVPITYFFSVPASTPTNKFYAFAGLGVGVRL